MTKYKCARCGKAAPPEKMIFSRISKSRYCMDMEACDKRRKRALKELA